MNAAADELIIAFLDHEDGSTEALEAADEAVFERMYDLWARISSDRLPGNRPQFHSKTDVERWDDALCVLARAHSDAFLRRLLEETSAPGSSSPRRTTVSFVLGTIDDPRAVGLLCRFLEDPDDVVRANVVAALMRHGSSTAARDCLVRATRDRSPLVRLRAIRAVSLWDAPAAQGLLEHFVREEAIPGLLRGDAVRALEELRSGLPISRLA